MPRRQASVVFILIALFIDVLGAGLVIPILPRLVQSLLGGAVADSSIVYGLLLSVYALMQFICAPILGALSDRFGRRPVILLALAGLGLDYVLLSVAPTVWWLVVGRVVAGIFGATFAPAGAYIADISPPEKRAANFGLVGVAFGLGFIAGPALGGLLGQQSLRLPFMVCAGLTLCNFLFGLLVLPESLKLENRRSIDWRQTNPVGALRAVWQYPAVAALLPVFAVSMLAQQGLQSVWVPYITYCYNWSVSDVGISLAIVGLLFAISQGLQVRPLVGRFGEQWTLNFSLITAVVAMIAFGLATQGWMMYSVTAFYCLGLGLMNPCRSRADVACGSSIASGFAPGRDDQRHDSVRNRGSADVQWAFRVVRQSPSTAASARRAVLRVRAIVCGFGGDGVASANCKDLGGWAWPPAALPDPARVTCFWHVGCVRSDMPKAKKTHVKSTHKDFAAKNTLNPPSSGDSMPPTRATPPQQQDPKRRIGQHTGAGEPPLMKK